MASRGFDVMSLYTTWINLIKEGADEDWLTDSQRQVFESVLLRWKSAQFVNLHGPSGSGKTFIARLLAKEHGYAYVHDLKQSPVGAAQAILDNAQYTRMLRPLARERGLGRVLMVTRTSIPEAMPKVNLELDDRDVRQFQAGLSKHCGIVFTKTIPQGLDLAEIIRKEVIQRGGEFHVHSRS
jgi:ABC-type taurine transport system ATPase subunit